MRFRVPLVSGMISVCVGVMCVYTSLLANRQDQERGDAVTYTWPVERVLLTATFGETRGGRFHNGIDLGGDGQGITPITEGDLVYYFDAGEHPLYGITAAHGNGNIVVVQHTETTRSYYFHMQDSSVAPALATSLATAGGRLTQNCSLGQSGNTGRSFGAHLHLGISDRDGYINPLRVLPAYPDKVAPTIAAIMLGIGGRTDMHAVDIRDGSVISGVDRFTLLARVWDSQENILALHTIAPYRVVFAINERVLTTITFDRIREHNGFVVRDDGTPYASTWSPQGYLIGGESERLSGQHTIRVLAEDFAGNQTVRSATVTFR